MKIGLPEDWLMAALSKFNTDKPAWYGWKKLDDSGNKFAPGERMKYENIILNDSSAVLPSKSDVDAKIQELKDAEAQKVIDKASAKAKLKAGEALNDAELSALFGD